MVIRSVAVMLDGPEGYGETTIPALRGGSSLEFSGTEAHGAGILRGQEGVSSLLHSASNRRNRRRISPDTGGNTRRRRDVLQNAGVGLVLLAHGDAVVRETLVRLTPSRGVTTIAVSNLAAAIQAAGHRPPAVLLCEPALLEAEPLPIGERLNERAGRPVRIIALTDVPTDGQRIAARRHGASFLLRPAGDFERLADLLVVHVSVAEKQEREEAAVEQQQVDGNGPTILCVDDSATMRQMIIRLLTPKGYRVYTSANASNALRFLSFHHVDLVISDLVMPHMDGFELKHEIDRTRSTPMPFVLVTSAVTAENLATALKLGSAGFLPKPVVPEALLETVAAVLADAKSRAGAGG